MAKSLNDILKGVNKSKEVPNDLSNLAMSPEGNKGEIDFAKKHKIQKHEDRVGNGDDVYNASKIKTAPYKKQDQKVYEENEELDEKYLGFKKLKASIAAKGGVRDPGAVAAAIGRKKYGKEKFQAAAAKGKKLGEETECNHSSKGARCEMHGDAACPGTEPKDTPKKGQKVLLDKQVKEGRIEDDAQRRAAKKLSDIAKSSNVPVTKLKPGKKSYNQLKSTGSMFGGARQFAAGLSKRDIESGERGSSVGKAKLKEEIVNEVAPPNPKIEAWIKSNKERFVKEYGKEKGMQVLYAKAWKMHGQAESGAATETDYAGPGAAGWSTGRHDVGTL
jgi:hypothetical protein